MDPTPAAPPVVAVVVAERADAALDATLMALSAQEYPTLQVLVVDSSGDDSVAAASGATAPGAFVRRVPPGTPVPAAADEVQRLVEGAAFYLFVTPGVVLETNAVWALVEEAYRSNAGVLGPKVLDPADPTRISDVGSAVDKFAVLAPFAEPGERDQEQHDAVRDVFSLVGAALVVRADLFAALEGFDGSLSPAAAVLDLCWRAHLAGARVMVVPAARAHPRTGAPARDVDESERLRLLLRLYSPAHLLRVLPQLAVMTVAQSVAALAQGKVRAAGRELAAWPKSLREPGGIVAARRRVHATRQIADADIRGLQVRGSAQLSAFMRGHLADRRGGTGWLERSGRALVGLLRGGRPWRVVLTWLAVIAVLLIGSRDLITGNLPVIGDLLPIRSSSLGLLRTYARGWHDLGLGTPAPAPTGLALVGVVVAVCLGATALARTVLVLGALLAGVLGAWHLTRPTGVTRARVSGLVAYAAAPVGVSALHRGSVPGLVAYATAPWLLARLARASQLAPFADQTVTAGREILGLGLLIAVATAFVPVYPAIVVAMSALLVIASVVAGGLRRVGRGAGRVVGGLLVGVGLNLPWLSDVYRPGAAWSNFGSVRLASPPGGRLIDLLSLRSGPVGGVLVGGLAAAALIAVLVARDWRLAWAIRGTVLAAAFIALAWLDGRDVLPRPFHSPELFLAPAAAGLVLAIAMGAAAVDLDVRSARISWRQPLAFLGSTAVVLAAFPVVIGAGGGHWRLPQQDFDRTFSFLGAEPAAGRFRVLWVGDPRALPLRGWWLDDGLAYAVSSNGPPDLAGLWPGTPSRATRLLRDALQIAGDGRTDRLGRLLAPMSVRYLVVPLRPAPAGTHAPSYLVPATLDAVLSSQLDLRRVDIDDALLVYENRAWIPERAVLTSAAANASVDPSPSSLAGTDLGVSTPVLTGGPVTSGRGALAQGSSVLLAQASSDRWHLRVGGRDVPRRRAFGWANLFEIPASGSATLSYDTPLARTAAVLAQALAWLVVVAVVIRSRFRSRIRSLAAPGAPAPAEIALSWATQEAPISATDGVISHLAPEPPSLEPQGSEPPEREPEPAWGLRADGVDDELRWADDAASTEDGAP